MKHKDIKCTRPHLGQIIHVGLFSVHQITYLFIDVMKQENQVLTKTYETHIVFTLAVSQSQI